MQRSLLLLLFLLLSYLPKAQITFDGNLNESFWGMPLATATGGPQPCASNGTRLNSLYATATDSSILMGVGGIVQAGYHFIIFIDSKSGGLNTGAYNRTNAPGCLQNLPAGTRFDAGFEPDYCLVVSGNGSTTAAAQLLPVGNNTAALINVGNITPTVTTLLQGCRLGLTPSATDFTKGYEISMPRTLLEYAPAVQPNMKFMAMVVADDGNLTNQFLTHADISAVACFGKGTANNGVQFQNEGAINPVEFNPSRSLPIDFISIRAFQIGQAMKLIWVSAAEKEMQKYEIERSDDAFQYNLVGTVTARGNATGQSSYEFVDIQPLIGKGFYRIKAIDRIGRSTYSQVMKVQYGRVDNTLTIYPNPVKDQINLQMIGLRPDTYHLQIFNDLGQCLIQKEIVYTGGYGMQQIPLLPNMHKGPYRLLLHNSNLFFKQNFIVQ